MMSCAPPNRRAEMRRRAARSHGRLARIRDSARRDTGRPARNAVSPSRPWKWAGTDPRFLTPLPPHADNAAAWPTLAFDRLAFVQPTLAPLALARLAPDRA